MKIAILGTGTVGQTLAGRLTELGHEVMLGTRNPDETQNRTARDQYGGPSFKEWHAGNTRVKLGTFAQAASFGEIIFLATQGKSTFSALDLAGNDALKSKVLIDVTNPLDFSRGMPPVLMPEFSNTTSLGEEIQKRFPGTRVVKALNTMWCGIMVKPAMIDSSGHNVFICGNDAAAKLQVSTLLKEFGWLEESMLDLGDISASRGTEMVLPLWLRIMQTVGNGAFNFNIVKARG